MTTVLFSCVQVEPVQKSAKENIAISTARDSDKKFPPGSTFSLEPKYAKETSLKPEQIKESYQIYNNSLIKNLEKNGYRYSPEGKNVAFHVGFGLALSNDVSDEKLSNKFGLTPGLAEKSDLTKGSFIVYIQDGYSTKSVWRGAVQGFTHENLSPEQRKVRVNIIVDQVMSLYYQGK
jgi:hypothetical protein